MREKSTEKKKAAEEYIYYTGFHSLFLFSPFPTISLVFLIGNKNAPCCPSLTISGNRCIGDVVQHPYLLPSISIYSNFACLISKFHHMELLILQKKLSLTMNESRSWYLKQLAKKSLQLNPAIHSLSKVKKYSHSQACIRIEWLIKKSSHYSALHPFHHHHAVIKNIHGCQNNDKY